MKVIVITKFKDKYTKVWHEINDELTINQGRYEEIKNFVKLVNNNATTKQKNKNKVNLK